MAAAVRAAEAIRTAGSGRATAVKIGTEAGAKIQIGRRVLFKVSVVEKYLDSMAGES